jgi:hypothetical protein
MSTATDFLERYQRATYTRLKIPLPAENLRQEAVVAVARQLAEAQGVRSRRKRHKLITDAQRQYKQARSHCPSRYEDPSIYVRLNDLAEQIHRVAAQKFNNCPPWPVIGTMPLGRLNAKTVAIDGSVDHVILFDSALLIFDLLFTKAVTLAIPDDIVATALAAADAGATPEEITAIERTAIVRHVAANSEAAQRFFEVIGSYAIHGTHFETKQYLPKLTSGRTAEMLRRALRLFVFGHEYGHILDGHFDNPVTPVRHLDGGGGDELAFDAAQEKDADIWGVVLASLALKEQGEDPAFAAVGADLFFAAVDVMDRALSILRSGDLPAAPELYAISRRDCLHRLIIRDIYSPADGQRARMLCAANGFIVELLWAAVEPRIRSLHDDGARPARQWQT